MSGERGLCESVLRPPKGHRCRSDEELKQLFFVTLASEVRSSFHMDALAMYLNLPKMSPGRLSKSCDTSYDFVRHVSYDFVRQVSNIISCHTMGCVT